MNALSHQQVREILPQRFPFIFVDTVISVDEESIVAKKCVTAGEPYFSGHFPSFPVMPGVLLVEGIAQTAILLAHHNGRFDRETQQVFFMGVEKAKFRQPVVPGDVVEFHVRQTRGGRIMKAEGKVFVEGKVVCEANIIATIK